MKAITMSGRLKWNDVHDGWTMETVGGAPLVLDVDSKLLDFAEQVVEITVRPLEGGDEED